MEYVDRRNITRCLFISYCSYGRSRTLLFASSTNHFISAELKVFFVGVFNQFQCGNSQVVNFQFGAPSQLSSSFVAREARHLTHMLSSITEIPPRATHCVTSVSPFGCHDRHRKSGTVVSNVHRWHSNCHFGVYSKSTECNYSKLAPCGPSLPLQSRHGKLATVVKFTDCTFIWVANNDKQIKAVVGIRMIRRQILDWHVPHDSTLLLWPFLLRSTVQSATSLPVFILKETLTPIQVVIHCGL